MIKRIKSEHGLRVRDENMIFSLVRLKPTDRSRVREARRRGARGQYVCSVSLPGRGLGEARATRARVNGASAPCVPPAATAGKGAAIT